MSSRSRARARRFGGAGGLVVMAVATALAVASPADAAQRAATAPTCRTTATAGHWSIPGIGSGNVYKVTARGMSCSAARRLIQPLTRRTSPATGGAFRGGPAGFKCMSFSVASSGDKLLYAGVCQRSSAVYFSWAAKP
jgi:hypothetical protein